MAQPYAYIFGYGSLIETQSRASTVASALYAQPAIVKGVQRGWFDRVMDTTNYSTTFLGAVATSPNIFCNGVIYPVSKQDFDAYVARESGYKPTEIKPDALIMLDGTTGWIRHRRTESGTSRTPSAAWPTRVSRSCRRTSTSV